ncbi:MAG: peptidoglycan D,D-transpeptidase FtsI family protein [Patescibacteria group bacterium]
MIKRRRRSQKVNNQPPRRIQAVSIVFILISFFIGARLFFLQVIEHPLYEALASGQHEILQQLLPERGEIYAETEQGLYPLAINRDSYIVYAVPQEITDAKAVAEGLYPWIQEIKSRHIDEEEEEPEVVIEEAIEEENTIDEEKGEPPIDPELAKLIEVLGKHDDPYEPIIKGITKKDIAVLQAMELPGVYWLGLPSRYYPEQIIGSHTVGFFSSLSDVKKGQYGLEGYWNETLAGKQGILRGEKDAAGFHISIAPRTLKRARDGADLIVTIDPAIQHTACTKLNEAVETYDADGGSVIILDPETSAILALCGAPAYNPNTYNKVDDISVYPHPAIAYAYEPGSIMKPLTMAAGLDSQYIEPDDTYEDTGEYKIAGYTIKNSDLQAHGIKNMTEVLELSLNTGMIHVAEQVGSTLMKKYFEAFGFGEKTNIELSGEVSGNMTSLDKRGFIYTATASYGQGITVTPLQIVNAFAAVANGGTLNRPFIVKEVHYPDGAIESFGRESIRQVVSTQASALLSGMMVSVIKNGYGGKAGVDGYLIAGKTGTAQVAGEGGKYSDKTIHSFVGYGPVDDPKFVMLVKLDHPTAVRFSSDSAAPVFGDIADFILKYYHVPPTELK